MSIDLVTYNPELGFLAWDGRRSDPLHVVRRDVYSSCLETLKQPSYMVIKSGSEVTVHRGERSRTNYSIQRIVGEVVGAKKRGLGATIVYSGSCALGRSIRNRAGERIGYDELEERKKDAQTGEAQIKGLIHEFSVKSAGEEPVFVDVTPEDFLDSNKRREVVARCLTNMSRGRMVWVNEKDAYRNRVYYDGPTFNENDGLSSLLAQELNSHAPTWLLYLMDRRGILPRQYFQNRGMLEGPEDSYVIKLVINPTGLEGEVVANTASQTGQQQTRITRGGAVGKIRNASVAARHGVPVMITSGMFVMHDSNHMRTRESPNPTPTRHNPVSSFLDRQPIGTFFAPDGLYQERSQEAELAVIE